MQKKPRTRLWKKEKTTWKYNGVIFDLLFQCLVALCQGFFYFVTINNLKTDKISHFQLRLGVIFWQHCSHSEYCFGAVNFLIFLFHLFIYCLLVVSISSERGNSTTFWGLSSHDHFSTTLSTVLTLFFCFFFLYLEVSVRSDFDIFGKLHMIFPWDL